MITVMDSEMRKIVGGSKRMVEANSTRLNTVRCMRDQVYGCVEWMNKSERQRQEVLEGRALPPLQYHVPWGMRR